ncbi:MAG: OmpA family protein [Chitinophagaceae bacterium]|nr:OmpA family protein [Chitinophagaceae bacterium]
MNNIRKLIQFALCILMATSINAQTVTTDWGWDWADTSKVAPAYMPQQVEFLNNQYPYPAKPRSQWELGLSAGKSQIYSIVKNYNWGPGFGISLRHAISHVISWRVQLDYMKMTGIAHELFTTDRVDGFLSPTLPYRGITTYGPYTAYMPTNANPNRAFAPNYRNTTIGGSFDLIFSLTPVSYYRGNPKWNVYAFMGYRLQNSDVDTRLTTSGGAAADFTTVNYAGKRKDIQRAVDNLLTGNYQNAPIRAKRNDLGDGNWILRHTLTFGGGVSRKLSDRVNIGIEERINNPFSGDMDALNDNTYDLMQYASVRVNINLGNRATHVQPLWWLNPLNYIYSELNVPRHMKLPKVVLPDGDGDGVTDQFDLEPNTPRGCPVDTHGVTKDTDGDGVPDCRDKEVLTPLKCFPVNADGVGTCPEPACCAEIRDLLKQRPVEAPVTCTIGSLPSVQFKSGSAKLSTAAERVLASAAATIKANPNCNIRVIGYGAASKAAQQMSWERVNAVIKYLTERQGISENRLLFQYGQDGDANTVDLQGTTETGPTMVPAPHPNLKSRG